MVERARLTDLLAQKAAADPLDSTLTNRLNKQIADSERKQKSIAKDIASLTRQRAEIQDAIDRETRRLDFTEFAKPKKRSKSSSKDSGKSSEDIAKEEAAKETNRLKKLQDLKNKIRDAEANKEDEARKLELKKIREHNKSLMIEALANGLLSQELIDSLNQKEAAKQAEFDAIDKDRQDKKDAQEIADAKANQKAKDEIAQAVADAKAKTLDDTTAVLEKFTGMAGEQTAAGKALSIASATINTYRGVSDALAAKTVTPFETALKFANAGAILASGMQNVQKIVSVKVPNVGGKGGGAAGGGGGASQPPAFNIVGASDTNQLADAIGAQEQQPVQAYVVANDVTTAQSLQNNIVEGATIG